MKVLLINKFYYLKGGAEKQFFDVKELLEKNGHEVITFAMQDEKNLPSPYSKYFVSKVDFSNVRFDSEGMRTAGRMFYSFEANRKISKLIKKEKPDIAHIHNIYHQISPSILLALKNHSIPVVQTLHDYKIICPSYSLFTKGKICERCKGYNYWQCIKNKCMKDSRAASTLACLEMYFHKAFKFYEEKVDVFLSPSQFMIKKIREWEAPIVDIKYLPNFIDTSNATPVEPGDYLLYFGRLSSEKGINTLIKAMKGLPRKLKIVGTGPQEKELQGMVAKEQITNIEFLGYKTGNELNEVIKNSLAVVVPSEWYENRPLTILEAFSFGKPVIGTEVGGIPELVREGETGYLYKLGSVEGLRGKINDIIKDKEKTVQMGKGAFEFVKQFSPENYYEKLIKVYEYAKKQDS
ncbi:glycosyltransferase family 4 protein [Patescibacteria group bacterium]|nr:glycosyltransferase family 4 protein [Patescibacteria group bacterium]MBU1891113.1 glycosyltransferase family 4 protein [Patescibacteria group bacterium]